MRMMKRSFLRRLVIGLALLTVGRGVAQSQSGRIPVTHGTSFAGTAVNLPGDLRGKVGVLVIGFSKSSGDVSKVWGQHLASTYENSHDVMYYQMPELESAPKLVR